MTRPSSASVRVPRALLCALGFVAAGAACPQNGCNVVTQSQRSNLDRVTDAILLTGHSGHTYSVSANPEIQHLRVLDLTTAFFVQSPNRFFPTSIDVGPETRRLASAPGNDARFYALDTASDQVFEIEWTEVSVPNTTPPLFTWTTQQTTIALPPTDVAPQDVAALDVASDRSTQLFVTVPDEHLMRVLVANDGTGHHNPTTVTFAPDAATGAPAEPGDVVVDPAGDTVVVSDNALPVLHTIDRASIDSGTPAVIDVDVGGPVSRMAVGVVDIGDGLAPVVVALRSDAPIAVAVRLFRPGFREDRVQVLGSAELPAYPLSAYVPDNRTSSTICCRALTTDVVAQREATTAWAAVGMANGAVTYLKLDAVQTAQRHIVRLLDSDIASLAIGTTADADWSPQGGDQNRRPTPQVTGVDNFGDPPFVPFLDPNERLSLVWEGPPPGLESVSGNFTSSTTFTTAADVAHRGLRTGDVVVVPAGAPGCTAAQTGKVASITSTPASTDVTIAPDAPATFATCTSAATIAVTFGAANEFVVFRGNGEFLGRLSFAGGPDPALQLPGAILSVAASSNGPPQVRGSQLAVPIDPHVTPVLLPLADPPVALVVGGGGFGSAGNMPTVITGGEMTVPNPTGLQGSTIRTRRMQIGTASTDINGLNAMFSCDEGESVPTFCDRFE